MSVEISVAVTSAALVNFYGIAPAMVAALPPSTLDPSVGQMRVYVDGVLTVRPYDSVLEETTVAPGTYGSYSGGY